MTLTNPRSVCGIALAMPRRVLSLSPRMGDSGSDDGGGECLSPMAVVNALCTLVQKDYCAQRTQVQND